jgi:hypothetical protein
MRIASNEVVEGDRYEIPGDLRIPDFLRRPFTPAAATLLAELPVRSSRAEPKSKLSISRRYNLA